MRSAGVPSAATTSRIPALSVAGFFAVTHHTSTFSAAAYAAISRATVVFPLPPMPCSTCTPEVGLPTSCLSVSRSGSRPRTRRSSRPRGGATVSAPGARTGSSGPGACCTWMKTGRAMPENSWTNSASRPDRPGLWASRPRRVLSHSWRCSRSMISCWAGGAASSSALTRSSRSTSSRRRNRAIRCRAACQASVVISPTIVPAAAAAVWVNNSAPNIEDPLSAHTSTAPSEPLSCPGSHVTWVRRDLIPSMRCDTRRPGASARAGGTGRGAPVAGREPPRPPSTPQQTPGTAGFVPDSRDGVIMCAVVDARGEPWVGPGS
ncbi:hypothetical protein RKD25_002060 [Streptomyces sp. SAI-124]